MTVKQLIQILQKCDENKVVIIVEPNNIGWDNIGNVIETNSDVRILMDDPSYVWIPVTERLPETEGYYAVRFENGVEDEKHLRVYDYG
jgi:hypothetical protein